MCGYFTITSDSFPLVKSALAPDQATNLHTTSKSSKYASHWDESDNTMFLP